MSTSPTPNRSRRPAGTPTGGQFAPEAHAEPEVTLGAQPPEAASTPTTDERGTTRWRHPGGWLHCPHEPAVEDADSLKERWVNGPAVKDANGGREWWVDGQLHRTDGPAVERANGGREWFVNDQLDEDEFRSRFPDADPDC